MAKVPSGRVVMPCRVIPGLATTACGLHDDEMAAGGELVCVNWSVLCRESYATSAWTSDDGPGGGAETRAPPWCVYMLITV